MLSFLPKISFDLSICDHYFDLLNQLINDACEGKAGAKPSDFGTLLKELVLMVQKHPIVEVKFFFEIKFIKLYQTRNFKKEDIVLIGLMNMISTIISKEKSFKLEIGSPSG